MDGRSTQTRHSQKACKAFDIAGRRGEGHYLEQLVASPDALTTPSTVTYLKTPFEVSLFQLL